MFEPTQDWNKYLPLHTAPRDGKNYYWTAEEENFGWNELKKMGVSRSDWFVCFHTRDSSYLKKTGTKDYSYHDFRDAPVSTYFAAANFCVAKGGFALRMGAVVEEPLPKSLNPRIIDYATRFRTDFLDLFVLSKCKFFLGSSAGLFCVPSVFDVPVSYANGLPSCTPWGKFSMFIPKKLWSEKENRYLNFREAFFDYKLIFDGRTYEQHKIKAIPNTEKEILELCEEMYNSVVLGLPPDEEIQKRMQTAMGEGHPWFYATSFISPSFFNANKSMFLCE
jgi:putative glycosyltransferase (TIGR04372 family)